MEFGRTIGAWVLFVFVISLMLWAWYDMFTTPQTRISALFPVLVLFFMVWFFTSGEFLGRFFKRKRFQTDTGVSGILLGREDFEGGFTRVYVSVKKYIADYNKLEVAPRNVFERFAVMLTPSTIIKIMGKTSDYEEVPYSYCEIEAGCLRFHGALNPDRKVPSQYAYLQAKIERYEALLSELTTIFESAKSTAGALAQLESRNLLESGIQAGVLMQNINKGINMIKQPPPQQFEQR